MFNQSLASGTGLDLETWNPSMPKSSKNGADIRVDKDQKGEVKLVTVEKDFEVFITAEQTTAEQSGSADVPSDFQVLRADVTIK